MVNSIINLDDPNSLKKKKKEEDGPKKRSIDFCINFMLLKC